MALIKSRNTKYGVTGEYNRIVSISNEMIEVAIYSSKSDRNNGKSMLQKSTYVIPSNLITELELRRDGNSPKVIAYTYLKTLSDFESATDD